MKYISWITCCLMLIVAAGCTPDGKGDPSPAAGDGTVEVSFNLSHPSLVYATRAGGENAVSQIDVLVFNAGLSGETFGYRKQVNTFDATSDGKSVTFRTKLLIEDDPQRIVILANCRDKIDALGTLSSSDTKDAVMAMLTDTKPGAWDTEPVIPMWGETGATYTITESTATIPETIGLLRMVARIDLSVSGAVGTDVFELTDLYLYNANTKGAVVPLPANLDASGTAVEAPTIPAGTSQAVTPFHYAVTDGKSYSNIYSYEKEYSTASGEELFFIMKGFYNGSKTPSFYRVDVLRDHNGVPSEGLLRNHLYRLTIVKVGSPGAPDAVTAMEQEDTQLEVKYEMWNESDLDMWYDGKNLLVVSDASWDVAKPAGQYTVSVFTDHKQGWKAEVTAGTGWLSIASPSPATGPKDTKTNLVFSVIKNDTGGDRTGTIRITAGDLTGEITVVQNNFEKNLHITILDEDGNEVDELMWLVYPPAAQDIPHKQFTVSWSPKTVNCLPKIMENSNSFAFSEDSDKPGDGTPAFGGNITYSIVPEKFTQMDVVGKRYVEKYITIGFYVMDGLDVESKQIKVRYIYSMP